MISILEGHEALRNLEEVTVGLVWSELHIKDKGATRSDFLLSRSHFEGVFDKVLCRLIQNLQQSPVYGDRVRKLVFEGKLSRFT